MFHSIINDASNLILKAPFIHFKYWFDFSQYLYSGIVRSLILCGVSCKINNCYWLKQTFGNLCKYKSGLVMARFCHRKHYFLKIAPLLAD
jgi:hypothetical protein